jgi:hypothetical protein
MHALCWLHWCCPLEPVANARSSAYTPTSLFVAHRWDSYHCAWLIRTARADVTACVTLWFTCSYQEECRGILSNALLGRAVAALRSSNRLTSSSSLPSRTTLLLLSRDWCWRQSVSCWMSKPALVVDLTSQARRIKTTGHLVGLLGVQV